MQLKERYKQYDTPALRRGVLFLLIFVVLSGLSGAHIIGGGIVYRDGFALYGGLGKAAIFGCIAFALLVWRNPKPIAVQQWQRYQWAWLAAAAGLFAVAWHSINQLLADDRSWWWLVGAHLGICASVVAAGLGVLGLAMLRTLWQEYRRPLQLSLAIAVLFYGFLTAVYALWPPLASIVLTAANGMLDVAGVATEVVPPNMLLTSKFGITVAQYCSGVESIALFTGLYIIVGLVDWPRLNHRRYVGLFLPALVVLFGLNIVRVFLLIMAGYHINPHIAFSLFHTYAGLVFFVLYSIVFWAVSYRYLTTRKGQ